MDRRTFIVSASTLGIAPRAALAGDDTVNMRDLYNKDLSFSEFAMARAGKRVSVTGFMAPPLKAESRFFVLTKRPLTVCPFCDSDADWPDDILAIYTKRTVRVMPFNIRIRTDGRLELGTYKDPETGFVSRVRLVDSSYERD